MQARKLIVTRLISSILALTFAVTGSAEEQSAPQEVDAQRAIIFADEFNTAELDRGKWNVVGPDFWVNREEQAYVDDPSVLAILNGVEGADGGALMLRPLYQPGTDTRADRNADFISGRINSKGKFDFTHGRAEARLKMPDAVGVWPAWWLLGNGRWPDTGEIDIMEAVNLETPCEGICLELPHR